MNFAQAHLTIAMDNPTPQSEKYPNLFLRAIKQHCPKHTAHANNTLPGALQAQLSFWQKQPSR
jgi:hypothetical protein